MTVGVNAARQAPTLILPLLVSILAPCAFAAEPTMGEPASVPPISTPQVDSSRFHHRFAAAYTEEHLDNHTADWEEIAVRYAFEPRKREVFQATYVETHRFGLQDSQWGAYLSTPLGETLTASIDGNVSPTHRVLAKNAVGGTLQYEFAPAWLVHLGARTTRYEAVRVNQQLLMLEHYFGDYSLAFAWRPARAFGTTANSYELKGAWYYGDRDSIGLSIAQGEEAANVGPDIVIADVKSYALLGRHWCAPSWALVYSASHVEQGDFYTRKGVTVGVEFAF